MADWKDDQWDEQMKRNVASGKSDVILREVDDEVRPGRLQDTPWSPERKRRFWQQFSKLPVEVQALAREKFQSRQNDPFHPPLQFKPLSSDVWSVRIGNSYRAPWRVAAMTLRLVLDWHT